MDEYIDREELRQSFDLYKTGFEWFHDKATKAYKLLQEVVERYCVDLDSEEDTPQVRSRFIQMETILWKQSLSF